MTKKINIVVAGSSGTIGTRLCEKLIENNYNLICIDKKKIDGTKTLIKLLLKLI